MNTFYISVFCDMTLVLLKSKGKMLTKWLSEQFWRCCSSIYVLLEYIIKYILVSD